MISRSLPRATDSHRTRVTEYRTRLHEGQAALCHDFLASSDSQAMLRGRSALVDDILSSAWRQFAIPEELALVAVGGYGRGELYPCSDIDLLILLPASMPSAHTRASIEGLVSFLWDIGLEIGHSVRSVDACLDEAQRDITVQTTLMEARLVGGNRASFDDFTRSLRRQLDPAAFFKGKRLEQDERYVRYQDTPYALEPNCKESPGGLRDLQVILWIADAAGLARSWSGLAECDVITRHEARQVYRLENFLQNLRIRLHYLGGRREDRLLFDHQEEIARQFGITPMAGKRASELLMQRYYRNAKAVTQLNTILLQNIGAHIFPNVGVPFVIDGRFQASRELLDVREEDVFEKDPGAILDSFLLLQQRSELKGMTARTLRALWRARKLINARFRKDPRNRQRFLQLLQQKRGLVHEFRRMNQYGVLARYLPAFGRIVGQMQHDLFHAYTVDQHILQVMRNLRRFTMPEYAHEYPLCSRLVAGFERVWVLYVAALFHDIAKGRGGDHSRLGMQDAAQFCRDHDITEEDASLIVWLVEHHLSMSRVAQKEDLSDPEVAHRFVELVKDERRLTALYLLTHADIRGTGPKVWNAWKGKLLEDLFTITLHLLRGGKPQQLLGIAERQEEARRLLRFHGLRKGVETELWRQLDTPYFLRHEPEEIAWHTRMLYYRAAAEQPVVKARVPHFTEGLQVMVYTRDQPDLFMRLCGFFSRLGYSIMEAKIHTTRHGYALDSFFLLDPGHQLAYRQMISLIEHDLVERLRTQAPPDQPATSRVSRQVRHFPLSPEVTIAPDEKGNHHVLSVVAVDRPGLLFTIARTLANHRIDVHAAKIATLGERAEDSFLISGEELAKTATLLRLEAELLEALQV